MGTVLIVAVLWAVACAVTTTFFCALVRAGELENHRRLEASGR